MSEPIKNKGVRSPRKKSYKKMSFDELIKEKETALLIINELRDMATNTLLEIEELTKRLNVPPSRTSPTSNKSYIHPTSQHYNSTSTTSKNHNSQDSDTDEEDEKELLEFGALNTYDGGNMSPSIRLIDPEETLGFRQYQ